MSEPKYKVGQQVRYAGPKGPVTGTIAQVDDCVGSWEGVGYDVEIVGGGYGFWLEENLSPLGETPVRQMPMSADDARERKAVG